MSLRERGHQPNGCPTECPERSPLSRTNVRTDSLGGLDDVSTLDAAVLGSQDLCRSCKDSSRGGKRPPRSVVSPSQPSVRLVCSLGPALSVTARHHPIDRHLTGR